jgi:MFS family permease
MFWGNSFAKYRRTSVLLAGVIAFFVAMGAVWFLNRMTGSELPLIAALLLILSVSMFFLAGATPAALGFLADVSERYRADRSAVMGLYSIFLGLGQVIGTWVAGQVANVAGVDGLVYSTLGFLVIAGGALLVLRRVEHEILPPLSATHRAAHNVLSDPPK